MNFAHSGAHYAYGTQIGNKYPSMWKAVPDVKYHRKTICPELYSMAETSNVPTYQQQQQLNYLGGRMVWRSTFRNGDGLYEVGRKV